MDYADENEWSEGHPLLATLIGCALLIAGGWFGLTLLPPAPLIVIMAAAVVVAGLLWGVAYAITLRRATANWKLLSFMAFLLTAAAVGYAATWVAEQRLKADLSTLMDVRIDPEGFPIFPKGAENRGPISKLYVGFVREMREGQDAFDAETKKADLELFADAAALKAKPAILSDCGRIGGLKTSGQAMIERRRAGFKKLVDAIQHTDYPLVFKRGVIAGMTGGDTDDNLTEMAAIQGRALDAIQGGCSVLARRRWVAQGPVFMFTNNADLSAFQTFGQQQMQANADLQRLQMEGRTRVRDGQMKMRSAFGTRWF